MSTMETFQEQYARICAALNVSTQLEVAEALGIRQALLSDATRRGSLPAEWLATLACKYDISSQWVLSGEGAAYLVPHEYSVGQPAERPGLSAS